MFRKRVLARALCVLTATLAAPVASAIPIELTASGQTAGSRAGGVAVPWTLRMIFDPTAMLPDSIAAPGTGAYGGASFLEVWIDGVVQLRTEDFGLADRGVITINDLTSPTSPTVNDALLMGGTTLAGQRFVVVFSQSTQGATPPSLLNSAELPQTLAEYQSIVAAPSPRTFQWGPTTGAPVVGLVESVAIRALPVPEPGAAGLLTLGALGMIVVRRRVRRANASTEPSFGQTDAYAISNDQMIDDADIDEGQRVP